MKWIKRNELKWKNVFCRPLHEDDEEEEENVVEDESELTLDKLNDDLAVSFHFSFDMLNYKHFVLCVCIIALNIQCLTVFFIFQEEIDEVDDDDNYLDLAGLKQPGYVTVWIIFCFFFIFHNWKRINSILHYSQLKSKFFCSSTYKCFC